MAVNVTGIDTILVNLNKEIKEIKGNIQKGLTLAGLRIKADSMRQTPVDVGNLRSSHYLVSGGGAVDSKGSFKKTKSGENMAAEHSSRVAEAQALARIKTEPFIEIGCTASYAIYVHENLEARHTTGKAKFLEDAIKDNRTNIIDTVKRFASR